MARYNKIFAGPVRDPLPQVKELPAAAAIVPGSVIIDDGTGEFDVHDTAGARGAHYVAQDNYLVMKGTDDAYTIGDVCIGLIPNDGEHYRVLLATANDVTEGDPLSSLGDGTVGIAGATSGDEVLFFAAETYNNNTGSDQLITVRKGAGAMPDA